MLRRLLPHLFAAATLTLTAAAQTVPTGFVIDTLIPSGLATPNDCCFLPDGRVLVANSAGSVTLFAGGPAVTIGTVPNVESGGERGMLSIAADPGFAQNGQFYVYYSSTLDAFMHLDRFTCTGDLANASSTNLTFAAGSRRPILGALPDNAGNHNGGSARFGPDGMLYLTVGDDAVMCNAQSTTSQAGCLHGSPHAWSPQRRCGTDQRGILTHHGLQQDQAAAICPHESDASALGAMRSRQCG